MERLIDDIRKSCGTDSDGARDILEEELECLNELADDGDLRYSDLEQACFDMGIDLDNIEDLLLMMC